MRTLQSRPFEVLVRVGVRLSVLVLVCTITESFVLAQPRSPRPPMVTGPLPLPILPALPQRDDKSFYAVRDVPHGVIEQTQYQDIAGHDKRMHVYLPPKYAESSDSYPVLYLNHGGGEDDTRGARLKTMAVMSKRFWIT